MDDFIFLLTDKEVKYKQIYQQMKTLIMEGTLKKMIPCLLFGS